MGSDVCGGRGLVGSDVLGGAWCGMMWWEGLKWSDVVRRMKWSAVLNYVVHFGGGVFLPLSTSPSS